jgi:hypothetical protein
MSGSQKICLQWVRFFKNWPVFWLIWQKISKEVGNIAVELTRMYKNPQNAKCSAENPPPERNPRLK